MMLVFLDTETTGLDPARHDVWEAAWAVDDGPVESAFLAHDVAGADPEALRLNGYLTRRPRLDVVASLTSEHALRQALTGATLVAANPAFDAAFLRARWGEAPWRYRLLDVEAYAMGALGYDTPQGLARIARDLRKIGADIPEPDHTAAADVATLRACFYALRSIYNYRPRYIVGADPEMRIL
jgi:hypothetical protein